MGSDAGDAPDGDDGQSKPPPSPNPCLEQLHSCAAELSAPFVVPADLQATIASFPHAAQQSVGTPAARGRRVRYRNLRQEAGADGRGAAHGGGPVPAAAGADGRRRKRRRVPGVRDAAEDLSDSSLPPAVGEDLYAAGASGSEDDMAGPEPDVLDTGPRAMELIKYYQKRISSVLALSLSDSAADVEDNAGTLFRVVPVAGGAAVVLSEGERASVVWAQVEENAVSYLCTCGGAGGGESAELRSWLGASSSCCHARGLRASFSELADGAGLADDKALLGQFPVLDNASAPPVAECKVLYATKTAKRRGVFAVHFQSTWAAVVVRNKLNKQGTKTRVQRRPACTLTSCARDHWTCPHATSVSNWCSDLREATAAVMAANPTFVNPFKDVLLPTVAPQQDVPATASAHAAGWAAFSDEQRGRCSRNLLPCAGEVAECFLWDQLADTGRSAEHPAHLGDTLCEAECFSCGNPYNGQGVKNTGATLHTLRGRVNVTMRQWICSCGEAVPYDGAHDGLFASSKETAFTRTYLDVLTQMVFTGHGTLSSAAAVLCFLLEATK